MRMYTIFLLLVYFILFFMLAFNINLSKLLTNIIDLLF